MTVDAVEHDMGGERIALLEQAVCEHLALGNADG
jgi:hypothetical protein